VEEEKDTEKLWSGTSVWLAIDGLIFPTQFFACHCMLWPFHTGNA
jgi:hypothetical protein